MGELVSVIGAGTAGLLTAKELEKRGMHTVVYDQKSELGLPVRASGIISINGLNSMGLDYTKAVTNTLTGARIHAGGACMRILAKEPVARVLDRKSLADICASEAESAGAEIVRGKRITGTALDELRRKSVIVGADGAVSAVARHFSMGAISRYALTYKAEFNVDVDDPSSVDLFFGKNEFPGLFAWICPNAKDLLEVGIGIDSGKGNARAAMERFLSSDMVRKAVGNAKIVDNGASMIPMRMRERIVDAEKRVLLVGDAAGQVKGTTGGGIVYGSAAAIIAAEKIYMSISAGESLEEYEKAYMKKYGNEMKLHYMINRFYSSMGSASLAAVIRLMNFLGMDSFISEYGDMDMPSLLIKRLFVRGLA